MPNDLEVFLNGSLNDEGKVFNINAISFIQYWKKLKRAHYDPLQELVDGEEN